LHLLERKPDIKKKLVVPGLPGLYMVETVDSEKLAATLNASWGKQSPSQPLAILLQINTSQEDSQYNIVQ
jgi:hypothetical protein